MIITPALPSNPRQIRMMNIPTVELSAVLLKELREAYPELRIIFITPPYTWYTDPELTCEEYDLGGGVLEDYVNAEIGLCEALNVEVIDIYHDYYPHDTWDDLYLYTDDGLHPNEARQERRSHRRSRKD